MVSNVRELKFCLHEVAGLISFLFFIFEKSFIILWTVVDHKNYKTPLPIQYPLLYGVVDECKDG